MRQQTAEDFLVLNADNALAAEAAASRAKAQVYWFSVSSIRCRRAHGLRPGRWSIVHAADAETETVMPLSGIPLKGTHNVENVLAAVVAARLAGASVEAIRSAVESFHAVEHRLEFVAAVNGVDFYNDSKATNVDATAKAIAAFSTGIHLILGGKDKNSDYTELTQLLRERVRAVYTIGAAAAKIESHLRGVVSIHSCETLDKAVSAAASAARPGEVVLLAPACSSFDQFENYEHRGRVFKELVHELRELEVSMAKAGRGRQVDVFHHPAADRGGPGDGLLRIGRGGAGALSLALHLCRQAGWLGAGRAAGDGGPDECGLQPL